jgi:DNA-binding protein H-NS
LISLNIKGLLMSTLVELKAELASVNAEMEALSLKKAEIEAQVKALERKEAKEALSKIVSELSALNLDPAEIAKALGLSVAGQPQKKVRAAHGTAAPKAKGIPKYRKSIDPNITWSGKGRKPEWVVTYLGNGGALEDLLIKY